MIQFFLPKNLPTKLSVAKRSGKFSTQICIVDRLFRQ